MTKGKWSLELMYPSYESSAYQADLERFAMIFKEFEAIELVDTLATVKQVVLLLEELVVLRRKLFTYSSLQLSADTGDQVSLQAQAKLRQINSANAGILNRVEQFLGETQVEIEEDELLRQYAFFFKEAKAENAHRLSDEVEAVIATMNMSAGNAWEQLQEVMTSTVEYDFQGKSVNLSEIRNLAYDPDQATRKAAYETELAMYAHIKEPVAFALNNIKSQVNDLARLRGFESPLAQALEGSRMAQATLDALFEAVRQALPDFRRYLKHKATLLGHQNGLPFYDLFAPIGSGASRTFTAEAAKDYLVAHFSKFTPDLAEMVEELYQTEAIDFYPRRGKVGGAFCNNLPYLKTSRILLNFDGSLSDVVTMAHELGHAYHGVQIESHRPLNWGYTMPVAETASTFNENIIMNSLLKEASVAERISLLESQISDVNQIIVDIYSRFLFEDSVFKARQDKFLFATDLEQMMLNAQKEAYGDGLDQDYLHPYMWVCKPHYYSTGLSYYNFPYAFGGLFAKGLYALYLEQGQDFVANYKAMLKATTVNSVEDTAKTMGVDLTTSEFWTKALNLVVAQIDEFIELTAQ